MKRLSWGMVGGGEAHAPQKWAPVLGSALAQKKDLRQ